MAQDITDTLNGLYSNLQNYIVAPIQSFGIGGFVFDAEGESAVQLHAESTDHYTESNRAIQDHVAIRPKRIVLKGYVGELVYRGDDSFMDTVNNITQKLTSLTSYIPKFSNAATQLIDALSADTIEDVSLSEVTNIFGVAKNLSNALNPQQIAYTYFKALMEQKVLMSVQTPWEFMANMMIESITGIQDEKSKFVTDFSISLKEFRFAQTQFAAFGNGSIQTLPGGSDAIRYEGDARIQAAPSVNIGAIPGLGVPTSAVKGQLSLIKSVKDLTAIPQWLTGG